MSNQRPEPPRRTKLPSVSEDTVLPGAVHTLRPSANDAPTVPPPKADPRPAPRTSMLGVKAQRVTQPGLSAPRSPLADEPGEPTLHGSPAPPSDRPERDSGEVALDGIFKQYEAKATEAERERKKREVAEAKASDLEEKLLAKSKAAESVEPTLAQWKSQAYKFMAMLTALGGAAAVWLTAHTVKVEQKVENVEATGAAQKVETDPLPAKVAACEAAVKGLKEWAQAHAEYDRQLWEKQGVKVPLPPNAKPIAQIETTGKLRKPNTVTGGTVLEVQTPPPPIPQ